MKSIGKQSRKCECCNKYFYNTYFFKWYSIITEDYLCTICFKCARNELFGTKYKHRNSYEEWIENLKE